MMPPNASSIHGRKISIASLGNPVGPSEPLRQTYNQLPFLTQPLWFVTPRNTRCGRGMICYVANVQAGQLRDVRHNLGRLVQGMIPISTATNQYPPRVTFAGGQRTPSIQAVMFDGNASQVYVWFF